MTTDLMALADRCEALAGPCRETDDAIASALFAEKHRVCIKGLSDEAGGMWMYRNPNGSISSALRFTGSIDAAMTLVPPRSLWSVCDMEEGPFAQVIRPMPCGGYINGLTQSRAATPTLALTAAALRAQALQ